jgi:hypothetical protein
MRVEQSKYGAGAQMRKLKVLMWLALLGVCWGEEQPGTALALRI